MGILQPCIKAPNFAPPSIQLLFGKARNYDVRNAQRASERRAQFAVIFFRLVARLMQLLFTAGEGSQMTSEEGWLKVHGKFVPGKEAKLWTIMWGSKCSPTVDRRVFLVPAATFSERAAATRATTTAPIPNHVDVAGARCSLSVYVGRLRDGNPARAEYGRLMGPFTVQRG